MIINLLFVALGFFAILGGFTVLLSKQPIHAAIGLLITVLSIAGLYMLLSASFLFMVQIIVYAGAIITLFLFILMFLNIKEEHLPNEPNKKMLIGIGAILMIPVNMLVLRAISTLPESKMLLLDSGFGGIDRLGMKLYKEWLIPFELISILLLIALIGAIVLTKTKDKRRVK